MSFLKHPPRFWPAWALGVALLMALSFYGLQPVIEKTDSVVSDSGPSVIWSPPPTPYAAYNQQPIEAKDHYTIFLVGDSMTAALGPHPSELALRLNQRYPHKNFIVDNYSVSSQSILSLRQLLSFPLETSSTTEPPALERDFDILVIESMGHNPLSQYPLKEGLLLQEQTLSDLMIELERTHSSAAIIFLSTIAPHPTRYAETVLDLPAQLRADYARERRAYLENFIQFAQQRGIPLVDIYAQTLDTDGSALQAYLHTDFIHPSQAGVQLIQEQIAEYILEQNLLPY